GVGKGDTNITGVLNYYHRNSIANRDRGFSLTPPFLSSNASPYNLQLSSDVVGAAGGRNLNPGGTEFASAPDFTNGLAPANRYLYDANNRVRAAGGLRPGFTFNPFNPFEQIISGGTRARLAEFGNRLFDNETDAWLSTIGIKGDKLFNGSWGYDAGFRYSQLKNTVTGTQVSASRFNRILNQADPIFNPTSPQFIGTTVPFNPFGDFRAPIPSNEATIDFARVHPKDED